MNSSILGEYGIDYKKGVERCVGDSRLYERLLNMFLNDDTLERAEQALAANDSKQFFRCLHEMKGACGSAELTALYAAVCPLVELLRGGGGTDAEIEPLFASVQAAYGRAKSGILLAKGGQE